MDIFLYFNHVYPLAPVPLTRVPLRACPTSIRRMSNGNFTDYLRGDV
jgi:hypothetical protein